jgi:hypothetical protein
LSPFLFQAAMHVRLHALAPEFFERLIGSFLLDAPGALELPFVAAVGEGAHVCGALLMDMPVSTP